MIGLLIEPFEAAFMRRAMIEIALLAVLAGVVGVHVNLRRLSFAADAMTHTIFPGVAIAFFAGQSLLLGALAAAVVSALLLTIATQRRVDPDTMLAVLIASFFSLGIAVVSRRATFASDLNALLFGRLITVDGRTIGQTAIIVAATLAVLAVTGKELVFAAFDRTAAQAAGLRVGLLDLIVNVLVALVVVAGVRAVGTTLTLALLVTPAAIGRLVARRLAATTAVAILVTVVAGWLGLAASYRLSVDHGRQLPAAPTMIVVLTAMFVVLHAASALVTHGTTQRMAHRTTQR